MGDYLTREQRELIEDLVFQTAEMENRFNSWEISPLPYEKCVYDHPEHGLVECTAVSGNWARELPQCSTTTGST